MSKYHIPLHPDTCYHIFNHAVGDDLLFRNDENFDFFLRKYALHTEAVCDTFAYSLMPNHFHFAIKIKPFERCAVHFEKIKKTSFNLSTHNMPDFLMERFSNLCNSYTKAYNKVYDRKGALFIDYMKRSEICGQHHFCNLINYIHFNAVHHGFCKKLRDWKWSSLDAFLTSKKTRIRIKETLRIFRGLEVFQLAHSKMVPPMLEYEFL
ncbi:MAG TPA: transposase [Chitinophagaceae bacterium]|nr:transposase [Chitinophagaceae bacterium]